MRSFNFLFFLLLSSMLILAPQTNAHRLETDGATFLNKIKDQIEEEISDVTRGLWPRGLELHNQAEARLTKLYQYKKTNPSKFVDMTLDYIEIFLSSLANLQTSELSQQSHQVDEAKKDVLEQFANIQMKKLLQPAEIKFILDANKFILFITDEFLPEFPVYENSESLIEYFKDLVLTPYTEYPFLTGVGSTLAAMWAWGKMNESDDDVNQTINTSIHNALCTNRSCSACPCPCHQKPKKTPHSAGMVPAIDGDVYLEGTESLIQSLTKCTTTDYTLQPIPVNQQGPPHCTYHTITNAYVVINRLVGSNNYKQALHNILTSNFKEISATAQEVADERTYWNDHLNEFEEFFPKKEGHAEENSFGLTTKEIGQHKTEIAEVYLDQSYADYFTTYLFNKYKINFKDNKTYYKNIQNKNFYFTMMDYRQHTQERLNIKAAKSCLAKLKKAGTTDTLRAYLKRMNHLNDHDEYHWPADNSKIKDIPDVSFDELQAFNNFFINSKAESCTSIVNREWTNNWLASINAYQQGKIVIMGWLSFKGNHRSDGGHWTLLVIVPPEKDFGEKPTVYHLDSCGTREHLPDLADAFLYDCMHFKLPTAKDSFDAHLINQRLRPNNQDHKTPDKKIFIDRLASLASLDRLDGLDLEGLKKQITRRRPIGKYNEV